MLLGVLVYGYATGVFSSRKLERATYDSVAFRFIAANDHPDHYTIAAFRRRFLKEIEALFVQVLLLAREDMSNNFTSHFSADDVSLVLIDFQPRMFMGVESHDRNAIKNNLQIIAKSAKPSKPADSGLAHIPGRPAPARKRPGCGINRCVKIAPVDIRHFCQERSGPWIDHIQRLRRCQALAVNEVVEASADVGAL